MPGKRGRPKAKVAPQKSRRLLEVAIMSGNDESSDSEDTNDTITDFLYDEDKLVDEEEEEDSGTPIEAVRTLA